MRYDPIMCMMVDDSVKTHDELSLAQKKQVVTELKGFLKKSYNFGDESEYARAYEDLRYMFTTGSRKSISGLFENTVKKTGANDSKTKDANKNEGYKIHKAEIRGDKLYLTYTDLLYGGKETESFTKSEAKGFLTDPWNTWEGNTKSVMMKFVKDSKTIDKAIRSCDEEQFYQIRFGSGKIEGIKGDIDFVKQYVKDLMKKYGEKSAFVSQKGKSVFSYINR